MIRAEDTIELSISPEILIWLGRDDYDVEEWEQVRAEAARAHNKHMARYLAGTPLLADYLAGGLDRLGHSVSQLESEAF